MHYQYVLKDGIYCSSWNLCWLSRTIQDSYRNILMFVEYFSNLVKNARFFVETLSWFQKNNLDWEIQDNLRGLWSALSWINQRDTVDLDYPPEKNSGLPETRISRRQSRSCCLIGLKTRSIQLESKLFHLDYPGYGGWIIPWPTSWNVGQNPAFWALIQVAKNTIIQARLDSSTYPGKNLANPSENPG